MQAVIPGRVDTDGGVAASEGRAAVRLCTDSVVAVYVTFVQGYTISLRRKENGGMAAAVGSSELYEISRSGLGKELGYLAVALTGKTGQTADQSSVSGADIDLIVVWL